MDASPFEPHDFSEWPPCIKHLYEVLQALSPNPAQVLITPMAAMMTGWFTPRSPQEIMDLFDQALVHNGWQYLGLFEYGSDKDQCRVSMQVHPTVGRASLVFTRYDLGKNA